MRWKCVYYVPLIAKGIDTTFCRIKSVFLIIQIVLIHCGEECHLPLALCKHICTNAIDTHTHTHTPGCAQRKSERGAAGLRGSSGTLTLLKLKDRWGGTRGGLVIIARRSPSSTQRNFLTPVRDGEIAFLLCELRAHSCKCSPLGMHKRHLEYIRS